MLVKEVFSLKAKINKHMDAIERGEEVAHHRMAIIDLLSDAVDRSSVLLPYAQEIDSRLNLNVFC